MTTGGSMPPRRWALGGANPSKLVGALWLLALTSCGSFSAPPGLKCGAGGVCPAGQSCGDDNHCHQGRQDLGPDRVTPTDLGEDRADLPVDQPHDGGLDQVDS